MATISEFVCNVRAAMQYNLSVKVTSQSVCESIFQSFPHFSHVQFISRVQACVHRVLHS